MRYERTDSNHLRSELFHEQKILNNMLHRLIRGTNHNPAADLISDLFQIIQTSDPVLT